MATLQLKAGLKLMINLGQVCLFSNLITMHLFSDGVGFEFVSGEHLFSKGVGLSKRGKIKYQGVRVVFLFYQSKFM